MAGAGDQGQARRPIRLAQTGRGHPQLPPSTSTRRGTFACSRRTARQQPGSPCRSVASLPKIIGWSGYPAWPSMTASPGAPGTGPPLYQPAFPPVRGQVHDAEAIRPDCFDRPVDVQSRDEQLRRWSGGYQRLRGLRAHQGPCGRPPTGENRQAGEGQSERGLLYRCHRVAHVGPDRVIGVVNGTASCGVKASALTAAPEHELTQHCLIGVGVARGRRPGPHRWASPECGGDGSKHHQRCSTVNAASPTSSADKQARQ